MAKRNGSGSGSGIPGAALIGTKFDAIFIKIKRFRCPAASIAGKAGELCLFLSKSLLNGMVNRQMVRP